MGLLLISYVTSGTLLHLSVPQVPCASNGSAANTCLLQSPEDFMHVKHLEQHQARGKHSTGGAIFIMSTTVRVLRARKALLLATTLSVTTRHKKELVALAQGHRARQ